MSSYTLTVTYFPPGTPGTSPTGHASYTVSDGVSSQSFGGNFLVNSSTGGLSWTAGLMPSDGRTGGTSTSPQSISEADYYRFLSFSTAEVAKTDTGNGSYGPIGNTCIDILRHVLEMGHVPVTSVSALMDGPNSVAKDYAVITDWISQNGGSALLNTAGSITSTLFAAGLDLTEAFYDAGVALRAGDIIGAVDALFDGANASSATCSRLSPMVSRESWIPWTTPSRR